MTVENCSTQDLSNDSEIIGIVRNLRHGGSVYARTLFQTTLKAQIWHHPTLLHRGCVHTGVIALWILSVYGESTLGES